MEAGRKANTLGRKAVAGAGRAASFGKMDTLMRLLTVSLSEADSKGLGNDLSRKILL